MTHLLNQNKHTSSYPHIRLWALKRSNAIFRDSVRKCARRTVDGTCLVPFPSPEWASVKMPVDTLMGSNGTQSHFSG